MALRTAYTRTLTETTNTAGSDWRYAVVIPGADIVASGAWAKIEMQGAGITHGDVWMGHKGAGTVDFDGNQKSFKVGLFSAPSGQTIESDPVQINIVAGQPLVVAYDAKAGGNYKRQGSLSGYSLNYKAGVGGSSNGDTTKSGYGTLPSATALVTKIIVGDSIEDFGVTEPPPPGEEPDPVVSVNSLKVIDDDWAYSSGDYFPGEVDKCLHLALFNPSGSGRMAYLKQITINADAETIVSLRALSSPTSWPVVGSRCNARLMAAAPASIAKLHNAQSATILGNKHSFDRIPGRQYIGLNKTDYPMLALAPGDLGGLLVLHTQNVGAAVNFHWWEKPI